MLILRFFDVHLHDFLKTYPPYEVIPIHRIYGQMKSTFFVEFNGCKDCPKLRA